MGFKIWLTRRTNKDLLSQLVAVLLPTTMAQTSRMPKAT